MEKEPHHVMPIICAKDLSNCIKWCLCSGVWIW